MIGWVRELLLLSLALSSRAYNPSPVQTVDRIVLNTQPSSGSAGEPLPEQPCIAFLDFLGRLVNTTANYGGLRVFARLLPADLPETARFAYLQQENSFDPLADPSAEIIEGWANFSGLFINDIADGYTINFYVPQTPLAVINSDPFNIVLGDPFEMTVLQEPGTATGGEAFLPQPIVAVVDRGGNPVDWLNEGHVTVSICQLADGLNCTAHPGGVLLLTEITSAYTVDIIQGRASFSGLGIDIAGFPYQLRFETDYSGVPNPIILSGKFTVGIGRAVEVRVETPVSGARGGIPFQVQPVVSVRDAGGNVVLEDSLFPPYSELQLHLSNNPTGALLSSDLNTSRAVHFDDGYATGIDFKVNKVGSGYQIGFTAVMRTSLGEKYIITGESPPFDVILGEPSSLDIIQPVSGAYAGGLPFFHQPIVGLLDGGGNLFEEESTAVVNATLLSSPNAFPLLGQTIAPFFRGIARYRSLKLLYPGNGYVIEFSTTVSGTFLSVQVGFDVLVSSEFEVMADDADNNDKFGASVAVFEQTAVIGAPMEDNTVKEVQRISTFTNPSLTEVREIQRIQITGEHLPEIQQISTCGEGGVSDSLSGYFTLSFSGRQSRPIRFDVHPSVMESYIMTDIPEVESITIEKVANSNCIVRNAYNWTIYFNTKEGEVPELTANIQGVSSGASPDPNTFRYKGDEYQGMVSASSASNVSLTITTLRESPVIDGTFRVVVAGEENPLGFDIEPVQTVDLPYDISGFDMKLALEAAMRQVSATHHAAAYPGFTLVDVSRTGPTSQGGYTWDITFPASTTLVYNWKQFAADGTNLTGYGVKVQTMTIREGQAPIGGSFSVWFNGAGPSPQIAYNEEASVVEAKLESLPTIDDVTVSRTTHDLGYTWFVTFHATKSMSDHGYVQDPPINLAPLKADTFQLTGTGSYLLVEYSFAVDNMDTLRCIPLQRIQQDGTFDENVEPECTSEAVDQYLLPDEMPVMGKLGDETGSVYVFYREEATGLWFQADKLRGSDSQPYDRFGWAVALDNSTSGSNTRATVLVVGAPFASYEGDTEQQTIVCHADSGTVAFRFRGHSSPQISFGATAAQVEAALESISTIEDVIVDFYRGEVSESSRLASNSGDGLCQASSTASNLWVIAVVTFLYPDSGDLPLIEAVTMDPKHPVDPLLLDSSAPQGTNGHRYGVVQVAEFRKGTKGTKQAGEAGYKVGAAYVFVPDTSGGGPESAVNGWVQDAKLLASDGSSGDEFGYSVTTYLDTVAVGSPLHRLLVDGSYISSTGAVYIFTRDGNFGGEVGVWTQSQKLVAPDSSAEDQFGLSLFLTGNTLAVAAPGKNAGKGRVYIFKRPSIALAFQFDQYLEPTDGQAGDRFGSSLHIDLNTIIIGAEHANGPSTNGKTGPTNVYGAEEDKKYSKPFSNGAGLKKCGTVYSFERPTYANPFRFVQKIFPRSPRSNARFGHSVAVERNLLLVGEAEDYQGILSSRRYIYEVETKLREGASSSNQIGNLFALTWGVKSTSERVPSDIVPFTFSVQPYVPGKSARKATVFEEQFENVQTEWLSADISAEDMQSRILVDLPVGDVIVTRSGSNENNGYIWTITFVELDPVAGEQTKLGAVNQLSGDADVEVRVVQSPQPYVHSQVHVFKRSSSVWKEHAVLRPEIHQDGDLFASSISLRGRYALVGAPNRDSFETFGVNGGAGYFFDMSFVNLKFASQTYTVSEGDVTAPITVERCTPQCEVGLAPAPGPQEPSFALDEEVVIQFRTVDGTARSRPSCKMDSQFTSECLWLPGEDHLFNASRLQVEEIIDFPSSEPGFLNSFYGSAFLSPERSQSYSVNHSMASKFSYFDFRAQSDYAPTGGRLVFQSSETSHSFPVVVTDDSILESPDETVNLLLFSSGMRPVPGGDYWAVLSIEDDGDNGVGTQTTYEQLYASQPAEHARYGAATSIAGDISVIGAPSEPILNGSEPILDGGAVYIYRRTVTGTWELEQRLVSPNVGSRGRFGTSLETKNTLPHRLIVGAPGESPPSVYIFIRRPDNSSLPQPVDGTGQWELEVTLSLDPAVVFDPRCDPNNSGTMRRCNNNHNPIGGNAFFGGENAVSIDGSFAAVGAKGLEAVFLYRMHDEGNWYFFQMLKSSDYEDSQYPPSTEHMKIYVKRELFGTSVSLSEETLAVGATLADADSDFDRDRITESDIGLMCSEAGFRIAETEPLLYKWELNKYNNIYSWVEADNETRVEVYGQDSLQSNSSAPAFKSVVTCEETDAAHLTISSNGVPDHPFGAFPLDKDTLFAGKPDNPNPILEQEHVFRLPRFPKVTVVNPVSVVHDRAALPRGIIGVALNGVPFVNPYDSYGDDTTQPESLGYSGSLPDLCNGVTGENGIYGYRSNPICLYPQPAEWNASVPQLKTGKLHHFSFPKTLLTNPSPGTRSPKIGYALDGFPIFGPFAEDGSLPTDLDHCNGRFDSVLNSYVYHITPWKEPYIIGCFRGTVKIPVPLNLDPFTRFMSSQSSSWTDPTFYGKGAVYVFMRTTFNGTSFQPSFLNLDPQTNPFTGHSASEAWYERTRLQASDKQAGDRYGHEVVLRQDQLLVSAFRDRSRPRTTWDFECGELRGWTRTGTAFNFQPTYEDNTVFRNIYGDINVEDFREFQARINVASSNRDGVDYPVFNEITGYPKVIQYGPATTHVDHPVAVQYMPHELREAIFMYRPRPGGSSKLKGKFWIGTFENRSAVFDSELGSFVPHNEEGRVQGDGPQGTLTSDPFIIYGTKIRFLIGGGCDIDKEYVELLVDGVPVKRETGRCDETMHPVTWDVSMYKWQSGVIRIVDASSTHWGHINVDDFRFNWEMTYMYRTGTTADEGPGKTPRGGNPRYSGEPMAGAVYAYRRRSASLPDHPCEISCNVTGCFYLSNPVNRWGCQWEEQQKLLPSDRRAYERFGWSVDFDATSGLAVIGAPFARVVDHVNYPDISNKRDSGAIYVFRLVPEERNTFGRLLNKPYWIPLEKFKVQNADKGEAARGLFAYSVGISGYTVVGGAPGKPAISTVQGDNAASYNEGTMAALKDGGSSFLLDVSAVHVYFAEKEFVVRENHQTIPSEYNRVRIQVRRSGDLSRTVSVAYTTSDITAIGISESRAAYCASLPHTARGTEKCGDYVRQSGILTFFPNDDEVDFELRTINDACYEQYSEYVLLQLSIPGGPPLLGEQYYARLRIDDDDQEVTVNRLFCPDDSPSVSMHHPFHSMPEQVDLKGKPAREEHIPSTEMWEWVLNDI